MKKALLFLITIIFTSHLFAQVKATGPVEKTLTDSICGCLTRLDASKIKTKQEATSAYTGCIGQYVDLVTSTAEERGVEMTDSEGMRKIGIDIAFNLMKNKCNAFVSLSMAMAAEKLDKMEKAIEHVDDGAVSTTAGTLKRIDNKGFNYIVITTGAKNDVSFIWLRQFPGSEKFVNGLGTNINKKVKIGWQEMEVYLPLAKGYYKVKEITSLTFQ